MNPNQPMGSYQGLPQPSVQPSYSQTPPQPPSRRKKILVILIGAWLFLMIGFVAIALLSGDKNDPAQNNAESPDQKKTVLTYVTKKGSDSTVKVLNVTDNKTDEEVKFTEKSPFDPSTGNIWDAAKPSVDATADGTYITFTSADNRLVLRNVSNDKEDTLISADEKQGTGAGAPPVVTFSPAMPESTGPGVLRIGSPEFSRSGNEIGFRTGHYEGGSIAVLKRDTMTYLDLGDTFEYLDIAGAPAQFTITSASEQLAPLGIFGEYTVEESTFLKSPTTTPNGENLVAILCPVNKATTGDSKYLAASLKPEEVKQLRSQRDCGELGDRTLISISLVSGTSKNITEGKFGTTLAIKENGDVFVAGNADANYKVTSMSLTGEGEPKSIDVAKILELQNGEKIESTVAQNVGKTPILEVYVLSGDKHSVKVIDLSSEKLVASVDLENDTVYNTLSLVQ